MKKNHYVEIFQDSNNEWRWHLKSRNGKILSDSGEGYKTKWGAKRAVKKNLAIDESQAKIIYPITAILLVALIWALATRTTNVNQTVQASKGTQAVEQQFSNVQPADNPQPGTTIFEPTPADFVGK